MANPAPIQSADAKPAVPEREVPRLLVPVDGRPGNDAVLRAAARLARAQGAAWLAVHMEGPARLHYSAREEALLAEHLRLAERLGAEVVPLLPAGLAVAHDLLALARKRRVTALVLPRPAPRRWPFGGARGLLADLLRHGDPGLAVHLVPAEFPAGFRGPSLTFSEHPDLRRLATALAAVAVATGAGLVIVRRLDLADVAMLYILCITAVATRFGQWAALAASVLSVAALDFFFIPPRFTFVVQDVRHVGTFGVMLGVGWVVANLAERIRAQSRLAQERERHTGALYRLGAALAEGGDAEAIQARVEEHLMATLGMPALVLLAGRDGSLVPRSAAGRTLAADELAVAQWAMEHGEPAGKGTAALPGARALFLPLAGGGVPAGVLALFQDPGPGGAAGGITLPLALAAQVSLALERARLAEERAEARLRVDHEQLRSTLLSSVSHDLRTPLGTITGATTSLLDPGPEADPADQRMLLQTIHQESCRLQRLVDNLLELTKLESGQIQVQKEWVPMEELVGSALGRLEEALAGRRLELRLEDAWVPLDPVLLEQVLLNLLENALKFSPPGSPIEIAARVRGAEATVSVADRGPGFAAGEEEKVFDKLYRGSRAASAPGAGLGLAICRAVAQAHGGSIRAANRPGGGALITLTLPVAGTPPALPADGHP
jgi:two-component system sensor histidine kinase KdpD